MRQPDRLHPEVRHSRWLARQQVDRQRKRLAADRVKMNSRNQRRKLPSAQDLDLIAAEEKAREATKGSE